MTDYCVVVYCHEFVKILMRHRLANCDKTTDGAFETMWIGTESYDFQRVAELIIPAKRDGITELLQDEFGLFGITV